MKKYMLFTTIAFLATSVGMAREIFSNGLSIVSLCAGASCLAVTAFSLGYAYGLPHSTK